MFSEYIYLDYIPQYVSISVKSHEIEVLNKSTQISFPFSTAKELTSIKTQAEKYIF